MCRIRRGHRTLCAFCAAQSKGSIVRWRVAQSAGGWQRRGDEIGPLCMIASTQCRTKKKRVLEYFSETKSEQHSDWGPNSVSSVHIRRRSCTGRVTHKLHIPLLRSRCFSLLTRVFIHTVSVLCCHLQQPVVINSCVH